MHSIDIKPHSQTSRPNGWFGTWSLQARLSCEVGFPRPYFIKRHIWGADPR